MNVSKMESFEEILPCFTIRPQDLTLESYSLSLVKVDDNESKQSSDFICLLCNKTFCNEKALQNHKYVQHDITQTKSDGEETATTKFNEQSSSVVCGFKYIPLSKDDECIKDDQKDGFTRRVFEKDTSFVIVKMEGQNVNMFTSKADKLDGNKKNQIKEEKSPIDLRGPFTCTFPSTLCADLQCRQIFFSCCEYSLHYREDHTKRRKAALRCQICEKRLDRDIFPLQTSLTPQYQVPTYITTCEICNQTFLDSIQYDEHNRIMHAKVKPFQCSICAKRFTQQGGLQQHLRMHTGIRPFTCTFCPKAFTQKAGLEQHLRIHTKVKPFKCVICNKCFSQSVHLRQHMRTHTNIQPFECSVCGRRFKQSSHLNFHMRSHVEELGDLVAAKYHQDLQNQNQLDYLNLANLQPVQDGETMYYAADFALPPPGSLNQNQNQRGFQPQLVIPENLLSF